MKQCPECNEVFDNLKAFCDMDGSELVKLTDSPRAISQTNASAGGASIWVTGVIGGLIGIIVCVLLYLALLAPGRESAQQDRRNNQNTETTAPKSNQVAVVPVGQLPQSETTASPTESESPAEAEASPGASPAAPATATPAPAALNNGPIATGGRYVSTGQRAIIKMKDGSSLEADAAWEDDQGIWFRRSGVVSFLDRSRVEAITDPPQKRPANAEAKTP